MMNNYYPRSNSSRSYQEMIDAARENSVNRSREEAIKRQIRRDKKKRMIRKYRIQGAIMAVVIMSASFYIAPKVVDFFTPIPSNSSYVAGSQAINNDTTHRTSDFVDFWFDYSGIVDEYDESMDFDSFVYGVYGRILSSGSGRTQINMNDFFKELYRRGYTQYSSFDDYCLAHGFAVEKDGKLVPSFKKYEEGIEEYMKDLEENKETEQSIQAFRSK